MANPFISEAKSAFQDVKSDLRSAYEAGDLTKQQFQEAKGQAKDILGGFKEDVRGGTVTEYANPFANFSYTPTGGIATLDTGTTAGANTGVATVAPPVFTPTIGDLYESLNPQQETKLSRLANLYASGELEGREGKIAKLERLLEKGDLGTLESFFAQTPTYTAPTDLGITLPTDVTYQQLADIFRADDPLKGYVTSERYDLTPEQIYSITSGYQPSYYTPVQTMTGIEDFLAAGKSDFVDYNLAVQYAKNPNADVFINNPSLATRAQQVIYAYQNPIDEPITATTTKKSGKEVAGSGQYGYLNNAPILNADIIDQILGDSNKIGGKAFKRHEDLLDELGWNFKSGEELNMINRGVRVLGLNENSYTPDKLKAMDSGEIYTDPETGATIDTYAGERQALITAAEKMGLDPSQFASSAELYKAIERGTEGLYMVTGQYKNQWDPEEIAGISDKGNHASVMYREVNGQLIPISDPNLFKYTKPKDPLIGGVVGDVLGSVPFLAEATLLIPGMQAYYPAIKAAQTAAQSGDIGDVIKSGGLAWLSTQFIPKTLGPQIQTQIGSIPIVQELAKLSPELANFMIKGGTNAVIAGGMAKLTGQDPIEAGLAALASSGVLNITEAGVDLTGIPEQFKPVVSRIISDVVLGRDPKNSLMSVATAFLKDEAKDFVKTQGKQNEVKDIELKA